MKINYSRVNLCQVSSTNLKNVACQIVVSLMPCLEGQPAPHIKAVVEILEELVVKNRRLLEGQANELPLLPSLPALEQVNAILQAARGQLTLRAQLQQATDGLRHESLSVRYMTASELNKLLCSNRKEIAAMMIGEESADADVISNLVTALMRGCVEESRTAVSQKLKMACALCLGELGAIDPVKLQVIFSFSDHLCSCGSISSINITKLPPLHHFDTVYPFLYKLQEVYNF